LEEIQFPGLFAGRIFARGNVCSNFRMQSANINPLRREQNPVPAEGDGGVFSQSWFPLRLSDQVANVRPARRRQLMHRTINEDTDILNTNHYRPGKLTRGDRTLARYLQFLRDYARAHPSGPFIN
jgi:hypothetical protein